MFAFGWEQYMLAYMRRTEKNLRCHPSFDEIKIFIGLEFYKQGRIASQ